jgi:hypothetical protein
LYKGSPRALLSLDVSKISSMLHPFTDQRRVEATAVMVHYKLGPCPALVEFVHLFPENALVGEGEVVPGKRGARTSMC